MIFKIKHNTFFWKLFTAQTQEQKTFNEKKFDEELKALEEKQKKIKSEYEDMKNTTCENMKSK